MIVGKEMMNQSVSSCFHDKPLDDAITLAESPPFTNKAFYKSL